MKPARPVQDYVAGLAIADEYGITRGDAPHSTGGSFLGDDIDPERNAHIELPGCDKCGEYIRSQPKHFALSLDALKELHQQHAQASPERVEWIWGRIARGQTGEGFTGRKNEEPSNGDDRGAG